MDTINGLTRHMKYALMSAAAAGIVSFFLISFFIDVLEWTFIPSVMIMVFLSAYFAFRRQMRGVGELTGRRIFSIASEVGTVSHFYTFALYFPLVYFQSGMLSVDLEMFGSYVLLVFAIGLISVLMFVWIAVPMYLGIGHILKAIEKDVDFNESVLNESLLDDDMLAS